MGELAPYEEMLQGAETALAKLDSLLSCVTHVHDPKEPEKIYTLMRSDHAQVSANVATVNTAFALIKQQHKETLDKLAEAEKLNASSAKQLADYAAQVEDLKAQLNKGEGEAQPATENGDAVQENSDAGR